MLQKVLIIFVSTLIATAVAEWVIGKWLFPGGIQRPSILEVSNLEFKFTAPHNELGFRGKTPPIPGDGRYKRVFLIGDSFVYGTGADESHTIPALLEETLGQMTHQEIAVFNFGLPDGNTLHCLETAKFISYYTRI